MHYKRLWVGLLSLSLLLSVSLASSASVRIRAGSYRKTPAVILYVPSRALLLVTGHYRDATGIYSPPDKFLYSQTPGPVYYGGGYGGYYGGGCGCGTVVTPPAYTWGHSPLDPPMP